MTKYTFEEICKTIKTDDGLKLKDCLNFHYFNKNGAVQAKRKSDKEIDKAVDAGICKPGAILAYGGFSSYSEDKLSKMLMKKRINRTELYVLIDMTWDASKKANDFVAAKKAEAQL
tara:strand:- start:44 stop:391 length:348 start_codon:yes stop_codon:yes gene_type:complete